VIHTEANSWLDKVLLWRLHGGSFGFYGLDEYNCDCPSWRSDGSSNPSHHGNIIHGTRFGRLTYFSQPRSPLLGLWLKVKYKGFGFFDAHHRSPTNTEDMGFKDKDVKTAQAIFKEQEEKPDHVDYEFKIWKGNSSL
jgi:hypothetical protein